MPTERADRELKALTDALDVWRRLCYIRYVLTPASTFAFMQQCKAHLQLCVEMREYFRHGVRISEESACAEVNELLGSTSR